jgi:hypothetical protein
MSALGQKPTYALQQAMSALHPIATAKADFRSRPCSRYPPKADMCSAATGSALGQKRTWRFMWARSARFRRLVLMRAKQERWANHLAVAIAQANGQNVVRLKG